MSKKLSDDDVERIAVRVAELIAPAQITIQPMPYNPWPNWNWPNYAPGYLGPYVTS